MPFFARRAEARAAGEVGRAARLVLRVHDALATVERVQAVCAPVVGGDAKGGDRLHVLPASALAARGEQVRLVRVVDPRDEVEYALVHGEALVATKRSRF